MEINPVVPEKDEKYDDYIQRIKNTRENKKYKCVYMERHHIIPRSWNGSNKKENLIYLLGQEHYYVHKILALENPHDKNMVYGWWVMSTGAKNDKVMRIVSAEDFAYLRKIHREFYSGKNHPCSKSVICLETNKEYANAVEVAKELGLKESVVYMVCSEWEKNVTARRFHFMYKENYTPEKAQSLLSIKGRWDMIKQAVYCVETGEIFESILEASKFANRNEANIRAVLYGRIETSGKDENGNGYHWRYVDESKNIRLKKCRKPYKVICNTTGVIYNSVNEACEKLNINASTLRGNIKYHTKRVKVKIGEQEKLYTFSYYEENEKEGDEKIG